MEVRGYVCWTNARIFRKPNRPLGSPYSLQTRLLEALLRETLGFVPQVEYEKKYVADGLRLKSIDVAGFHCGRDHWVFAEVKRDSDRPHPEQKGALSFLRHLCAPERADVFLARVRLRAGE